jgi:single-strand DNA-binding protein
MNQIILKGRLGQDPELKVLDGGITVVNFSIATNDGTKDKPKTNWHNCTSWNKTAETINKYFRKGDEILVSGKVDYQKPKEVRYTNISVFNFEFCGNKSETPEAIQQDETGGDDLPF